MQRTYAWQLARRYIWSRRGTDYISWITWLSIAGIAISVAAMIIIVSVMDGFGHALEDQLMGIGAPIQVEKIGGLDHYASVMTQLEKQPGIAAVAPFITDQGFVKTDTRVAFVGIQGIDPTRESTVTALHNRVVDGQWHVANDAIMIGQAFARFHQLNRGDTVTLWSADHQTHHTVTIAAIFKSGVHLYDSQMIYTTIPIAQALSHQKNRVSGLNIAVSGAPTLTAIKAQLSDHLGDLYTVSTWMDLNPIALQAMRLEKTIMILIVSIILVVAIFSVASTLLMTLLDKTNDIGILRSLGANHAFIRQLFFYQGIVITGIGLIIGLMIGTIVSLTINPILGWIDRLTGFHPFPPSVYYFETIPIQLNPLWYAYVMGISLFLTLLCAWLPAHKAAKLDPVQALKYE